MITMRIACGLEGPVGSLANLSFTGYSVIALHIVNHIGWRSGEVAYSVGLILQRPVLGSWVVCICLRVEGGRVEGVVPDLAYLLGRQSSLKEPCIVYVTLEVVLARLVSSYSESASAGFKRTCRDGAVSFSIYIIGNTLVNGIAYYSYMLPRARLG